MTGLSGTAKTLVARKSVEEPVGIGFHMTFSLFCRSKITPMKATPE
ncbi:hypothetical protein HMPREF9374_2077 [Desmospora sp. 8437]|nr:hypothetical protein HMPREF9374_2077 [Desmospora sp. 8437]